MFRLRSHPVSLRPDGLPEPNGRLKDSLYGYWPMVEGLVSHETLTALRKHPLAIKDISKGRVWLHMELKQGSLATFVELLEKEKLYAKKFYMDYSIVSDIEKVRHLKRLAQEISKLPLNVHSDLPFLDYNRPEDDSIGIITSQTGGGGPADNSSGFESNEATGYPDSDGSSSGFDWCHDELYSPDVIEPPGYFHVDGGDLLGVSSPSLSQTTMPSLIHGENPRPMNFDCVESSLKSDLDFIEHFLRDMRQSSEGRTAPGRSNFYRIAFDLDDFDCSIITEENTTFSNDLIIQSDGRSR